MPSNQPRHDAPQNDETKAIAPQEGGQAPVDPADPQRCGPGAMGRPMDQDKDRRETESAAPSRLPRPAASTPADGETPIEPSNDSTAPNADRDPRPEAGAETGLKGALAAGFAAPAGRDAGSPPFEGRPEAPQDSDESLGEEKGEGPGPKRPTKSRAASLFDLFSSMRFAVALLTLVGVASIIGTFLPQTQSMSDLAFEYGPFWAPIFRFLGMTDVYSSYWFIGVMCFLVASLSFCLFKNTPVFLREMRSWRLGVTWKSLGQAKRRHDFEQGAPLDVAQRFFEAQGYKTKRAPTPEGELVACKKGYANKYGFILAHGAMILIFLGGLIDSDLWVKAGIWAGRIVPDKTTIYSDQFGERSTLPAGSPSYRSELTLAEGQAADSAFVSLGDRGALLLKLPFVVSLDRFDVDYYPTGMPKNYSSFVTITPLNGDPAFKAQIEVNKPLAVDGVSLYQAGLGDGGSSVTLDAWNLSLFKAKPETVRAVSMKRSTPLKLGDKQYTVSFGELRTNNVVANEPGQDDARLGDSAARGASSGMGGSRGSLSQKLANLRRAAPQGGKTKNLGPSLSYEARDEAGVGMNYMTYQYPFAQDGGLYYFFGLRPADAPNFSWVMIPADSAGKMDLFLQFRELLMNPAARARAAQLATQDSGSPNRAKGLSQIVEMVLGVFAQKGIMGVNELITNYPPQEMDQTKATMMFYDILRSGEEQLVNMAQDKLGVEAKWESEDDRSRFMFESLNAHSALLHYPLPILLHLRDYEERPSSTLQLTRSPGEKLVYLGSLLLCLGVALMFYWRDGRAWLLRRPDGSMRLAATQGRYAKQFDSDFGKLREGLEQLAKDFGPLGEGTDLAFPAAEAKTQSKETEPKEQGDPDAPRPTDAGGNERRPENASDGEAQAEEAQAEEAQAENALDEKAMGDKSPNEPPSDSKRA